MIIVTRKLYIEFMCNRHYGPPSQNSFSPTPFSTDGEVPTFLQEATNVPKAGTRPPPSPPQEGMLLKMLTKPVLVTPHAPSDWLRGVDT